MRRVLTQQPTRLHVPQQAPNARRPHARVGVAAIQHRHTGAAARGQRSNLRDGMPPGHQHDVRLRLEHGVPDVFHVQTTEAGAIERIRGQALPHDAPPIAFEKRCVPLERPIEPDRLLFGRRTRGIQHRQIDCRTVLRQVPEPGRVVLHRMRLDDGEASRVHRSAALETRSNTPARRPASARADTASST